MRVPRHRMKIKWKNLLSVNGIPFLRIFYLSLFRKQDYCDTLDAQQGK